MASGRGVSEIEVECETGSAWPAVLGERSASNAVEAGAIEVALLWGERLLDLKQFARGEWPTLGHLPQDSIHLFAKGVGGGFPLIREVDGERILSVPVGARVTVFGERTLEEPALTAGGFLREAGDRPGREVVLHPGERALLSVGALQIAVRTVAAPARAKVHARDLDFSFFKLAAVVGLIAAAIVTVMLLPGTSDTLMDDSIFHQAGPVISKLVPKPPPKAKVLALKTLEAKADAPTQQAPDAAPPKAHRAKRADEVGLIAVMKDLGPAGIFAPGPGLGRDIDVAINNLGPGRVASNDGFGGRGGGPRGGGGDGPGAGFDIGNRIAGATCDADCRAKRLGEFGVGHTRAHIESGAGGKTTVVGGLDRDVIAKEIKRHQTEIKACYERMLNQHPDLRGKVAVSFTIDGTGHVAESFVAETSLENAEVERCILSRINRWRFPEPKGGGVVAVNYPWIFRPVGAD